jgi:hypothetical protein
MKGKFIPIPVPKHHAMEVKFHILLTSKLQRDEWSPSRCDQFKSGGRTPGILFKLTNLKASLLLTTRVSQMKTVKIFLNLIYWMKAVHNYIIFST